MIIIKRNGEKVESNTYTKRDSICFTCLKCGKEASRRVDLFLKQFGEVKETFFICQQCNTKQRNLKKYGFENVMQVKEIKEKLENNNIKKYGKKNPMQTKELSSKVGEKVYKSKLEKSLTIQEISLKMKEQGIEIIDKKIPEEKYSAKRWVKENIPFTVQKGNKQKIYTSFAFLRKKNFDFTVQSYEEINLRNFIKELGFDVSIYRDSKFEIDVFIEKLNIGFEYNGLFWHSEKFCSHAYHLEKLNYFKEKGIRLIQIFEDEWIEKNDIVKNRIKHILGIYDKKIGARNCLIKEITPDEKNKFLEENHIQGRDSSSIKIGAFFENELIGVMTFIKGRISLSVEKETWELSRFASKNNYMIIGIGSKMLTFFIKKYKPKKIISFCDKRWNVGTSYEKMGFLKVKDTKPNYWWCIDKKRWHRFNFRKNSLIRFENYNKEKSEKSIMNEKGYFRVFDCGSIKFLLEFY